MEHFADGALTVTITTGGIRLLGAGPTNTVLIGNGAWQIQGAYAQGLSMMWVSYLQSFSTHAGRKPRVPGTGDAANRL